MLTELPAWKALENHRRSMETVHMRDLFAADARRPEAFSLSAGGLLLDYSRHRITADTMTLLTALAKARDIVSWRDRMFAGEKINLSENRSVLHTALRQPASAKVIDDGRDIIPDIHDVLRRMMAFSEKIRTGQKIKNIVHIGIGGSDLGPRTVCEALRHLPHRFQIRFVSNVDACHLHQTLEGCDAAETLFLVASKTFTTAETMANARSARQWLVHALKDEKAVARHFVALTANGKEAAGFGIAADNIFPFSEGVGGRYSLWSSIGLPIALAYGFETFRALLEGAQAMDAHFREAPLERNMPVILALLGIWYRNFWNAGSYAVLPYAQNLSLLPAWLQQTDMESNGKSAGREGQPVSWATGPVVFGAAGTDCQHSFCQLLHQGTDLIPCDFIGMAAAPVPAMADHHRMLVANMIAQAQALMQGRAHDDPQRAFSGNRPSSVLMLDRLNAERLGALLVLYEHKIFAQGVIWNLNSFDQWGVELGKVLAGNILKSMETPDANPPDAATAQLLAFVRKHQG